MNVKIYDIAAQNGFYADEFEHFLVNHGFNLHGFFSDSLADSDVQPAVDQYRAHLNHIAEEQERQPREEAERAAKRAQEEAERARRQQEKNQALAAMLVTSGFNFDGYTIKKYSGYISGDHAVQVERDKLFAGNGQHLTDSLVRLRVQALKELKEAAYDLGCNAVVGVDFDYMTFEPESIQHYLGNTTHYYEPYVICVTANGNAVIIEKN